MMFATSRLAFFFLTSCLFVIKAAPTPTSVFDGFDLEARHDGHNETVTGSASSPAETTDFKKQNGLDAQKLNVQFKELKETDACQSGQQACVDLQFAQCVGDKWVLTPCAADTFCYALPLVNKPGTSLVCDTKSDATSRFEASGVTGGPDASDAEVVLNSSGTPSPSANALPAANTKEPNGDDDEDCDEGGSTTLPSTDSPGDDSGDCDDDDDGTTSVAVPRSTSKPEAQASAASVSATATETITRTVTSPLSTANPSATNSSVVFTRMTVERRQIFTGLSSSPSSPSPTTLIQSSSSSSTAAPTSSVTNNNNIVTITVVSVSVSTVTVAATDCATTTTFSGGTPVAAVVPTTTGTFSLTTSIRSSAINDSNAPTPSTLVTAFSFSNDNNNRPSPTTTQAQTVLDSTPASSNAASSPKFVKSLEAADPATSNTPTATSAFGGISFSTQDVPPTPAPEGPADTATANISELLTATLSP